MANTINIQAMEQKYYTEILNSLLGNVLPIPPNITDDRNRMANTINIQSMEQEYYKEILKTLLGNYQCRRMPGGPHNHPPSAGGRRGACSF